MKTLLLLQTSVVLLLWLGGLLQVTEALEGCDDGVDMVFLIDTSRSMTRQEFDLQMEFVTEFTNDFKIGPENVQVSVVQFAHRVYRLFYLKDHHTNAAVNYAIKKKHKYFRGSTKTSKAFKYLRKRIFREKYGMRPEATKIVVTLTDGMPNNPKKTRVEAQKLKDMGITMVTIAIGNEVDEEMLYDMASSREVAFNVSDFFNLELIRPVVEMEACRQINPTFLPNQCRVGIDIAFLLDQSRSLDTHDHEVALDFVEAFSRQFMVSSKTFHSRVSVTQFAHKIYDHFCFHEFMNNYGLSLAINKSCEFPEGSTRLSKALRFVREKVFTSKCGARPGAFKLAVIVGDFMADFPEKAEYEAELLKSLGVKVATVGVGEEVDLHHLHHMACSHDLAFESVHEVSLEKVTAHVSSGACEIALNHNHRTWEQEEDLKLKWEEEIKKKKERKSHSHHEHAILHYSEKLHEEQRRKQKKHQHNHNHKKQGPNDKPQMNYLHQLLFGSLFG